MIDRLNPFAELLPHQFRHVLSEWRSKKQADASHERLVAGYRELLDDPRYQAIRKEAEQALSGSLNQVMKQALKCKHCAPDAQRVVQLQEVLSTPLHTVWEQDQQAAMDARETPAEVA